MCGEAVSVWRVDWMSAITLSAASMLPSAIYMPRSRQGPRTLPGGRRSRSSTGASALALFAQPPECLIAIDWLHTAGLHFVVAAVQSLSQNCSFFEIAGKRVLNDLLRCSAAR